MTYTHPNRRSIPLLATIVAIGLLFVALVVLTGTATSDASHGGDREHPVAHTFTWGYPPNTLPTNP